MRKINRKFYISISVSLMAKGISRDEEGHFIMTGRYTLNP